MTARSRQRQPSAAMMRCNACNRGDCENCTDVTRVALGLDQQCPCERKNHLGEPHGSPDHVCNELCAMVNSDPED